MILLSAGRGAPAGVLVLVASGRSACVAVVAGQGEVVILTEGAGAQGDSLGPGQEGDAQPLTAGGGGAFSVFFTEDKHVALQVVKRRKLVRVLYGSLVDPRKHLKIKMQLFACIS